MSEFDHDVLGIGNAIVDILSRCDDAFLEAQNLPKGHMQLIDEAEVDRLYSVMGPATEISGGSAANTIAGLASFGAQSAFIGKVSDDQFGRIFSHDIRSIGFHPVQVCHNMAVTHTIFGLPGTAKHNSVVR